MLSIIVVNYKNPPLLRLCLKCLQRTISPKFEHEIIVVDSESSPETRNIVLEDFKDIKFIPFKENIGYTRMANEGIKSSRGDAIFIINADIVPLENSIEKIYEYLKSHPEIGLIGPKLLNFNGTSQNSCFRFYGPMTIVYRRTFLGKFLGKKEMKRFLMADKDLSQPIEVDWLMGSALMASKEAIQKVGLLDKNLFLYISEVDWARRFWENGYKVVYYPSSEMFHYHHRQSKGRLDFLDVLRKETRWHIMDAIRYFNKWGWIQ